MDQREVLGLDLEILKRGFRCPVLDAVMVDRHFDVWPIAPVAIPRVT